MTSTTGQWLSICALAWVLAAGVPVSAQVHAHAPVPAQVASGAATQGDTLHVGLNLAGVAQLVYLKASNPGVHDGFGRSVAISGDTLAIGVPSEDSAATGVNGDQGNNDANGAGAVYVFVRDGSCWSQQAYLKASNAESFDLFGGAVSLSGDLLVVGASGEGSAATGVNGDQGDNGANGAGAVYVFERSGGVWAQQAYLKASNAEASDGFGRSVSISGDTLVVGAPDESSAAAGVDGDQGDNAAERSGAAYVFVRSGASWVQQAYLKASNPQGSVWPFDLGALFGSSVSVSGETLVVGAAYENGGSTGVDGDQGDPSKPESGAAYVFARSGGVWSQQAYLKASNTDAFDSFGQAVALSGDTLVVGAPREDGATPGVGGASGDNTLFNAGAAYVFTRDGVSWSQQASLKASLPGMEDHFGASLCASGDTLVVGSIFEDSGATGIDGDEADDSASESGAAYAFTRDGASWSQRAYLKASNTDAGDGFGSSLALSGHTLVAGASEEDSAASGVDGDQDDDSHEGSGAAYVFDLAADTSAGWKDMGCALAGVTGDPTLVGVGDLVGGSANEVNLGNAAPSAPAGLFLALAASSIPFKGGTLKPFPFFDPLILSTSASGEIPVPFSMPVGLPAGTEIWVQWAIQDGAAVKGVALSNALRGLTP